MPPMNVPQTDAKCPAVGLSGMCGARHRHIRSYTRSSISQFDSMVEPDGRGFPGMKD
jgi:hypothetical protein